MKLTNKELQQVRDIVMMAAHPECTLEEAKSREEVTPGTRLFCILHEEGEPLDDYPHEHITLQESDVVTKINNINHIQRGKLEYSVYNNEDLPLTLPRVLNAFCLIKRKVLIEIASCQLWLQGSYIWDLDKDALEDQSPETQRAIYNILTS